VLPDATLLASVVDGAILVVRAGSTPLELVKRAVAALDAKKTLGVVLNGTTRPIRDDGYGYDNYPGHTDSIETRGGAACQPYSLS
jgi:Mrp family chromosome partitioning ATPase